MQDDEDGWYVKEDSRDMNTSVIQKVSFRDRHWKVLISSAEQRRVVPVIGPELLLARDGEAIVPFYSLVAKRLARRFDLGETEMVSLDKVIATLKHAGVADQDIHAEVDDILEELENEPQPMLDQLASVRVFRLFLTTTPDNLMTKALERVGVSAEVRYFSSNYRGMSDLPGREIDSGTTCVYHLYGKSGGRPDYALSEDERLEYSCLWMDADAERCPRNLPRYLSQRYLLILGCGYENWLARFFLFGLKGRELFTNVSYVSSVLADSRVKDDVQLREFVARCHGNTYCDGDVKDFVEKLSGRLRSLQQADESATEFGDIEVRNPHSVFISYASENREIALKIKEQLERAGVPAWLDKFQLESGDEYEAKIKRCIRESSFFLPILSRVVAEIAERRFFRVEWREAEKESEMRAAAFPFVHPIAIDDVEPSNNFRDFINNLHWERAMGGKLDAVFLQRLKSLFEQQNTGRLHE